MKKIAVISDTHIPRKSKTLPLRLLDGIKGVDLIIHAGDISTDHVIYELGEIAPVEAVCGNTDDGYVQALTTRRKLITVEDCRVGIIHGDGTGKTTLDRAAKAFSDDDVNCVVFGHSHIPMNEFIGGILYFNPGSSTDKRRQEYFSYGILEVDRCDIRGEIIYF